MTDRVLLLHTMTEAEQKITGALEKELDVIERKCIRSLQVS